MLFFVTELVLDLQSWYEISTVIPLAGIVFSNAMNTVCLAAERIENEIQNTSNYTIARNTALLAAMIPVINSLLAVGLVSLPGVMTGQILSGVSPLIAVRYQIVIRCVIFSASTLSTICYLSLAKSNYMSYSKEK